MFEDLKKESDNICQQTGEAIFRNLIYKFGNKNVESCDKILNSLCVALVCLGYNQVDKDNIEYFIQLVVKILRENLNKQYEGDI